MAFKSETGDFCAGDLLTDSKTFVNQYNITHMKSELGKECKAGVFGPASFQEHAHDGDQTIR